MADGRALRRTRGQGLVELALVTPVLLLIFLGVVDFSRLFYAYVATSNAARVGAEAAMNSTVPNDQVVHAVRNEASPMVSFTNVVLSPTVRSAGGSAQIGVTYVFSPVTPLVANFWGGGALPLVVTSTAHIY